MKWRNLENNQVIVMFRNLSMRLLFKTYKNMFIFVKLVCMFRINVVCALEGEESVILRQIFGWLVVLGLTVL